MEPTNTDNFNYQPSRLEKEYQEKTKRPSYSSILGTYYYSYVKWLELKIKYPNEPIKE